MTLKTIQNKVTKAVQTKQAFSISYYSRLEVFKASSGKLTLDPKTMRGYSYNWYRIVDFIGGQVVLNTYRYSVTTAKHVSKLQSLFRQLDIPFVAVQAPQGLQSLDLAMTEMILQKAALLVKMHHARKTNVWEKNQVKSLDKSIKFLKLNKVKHTMRSEQVALKNAILSRKAKLAKLKDRREFDRKVGEVTVHEVTVLDTSNNGHEKMFQIDSNDFRQYNLSDYKRRAVTLDFDKIYVVTRKPLNEGTSA